ncbi:hypothetical protein RchiOBHm_Chr2g0113901 [Rosa chinensis]|uniref:Uncharacterized protein n=1 Tax=Rosa chinensis TaxID=74649 RepID=A0A2P6RQQ5_ROSCH|nr:hypothetical protein RchiOBHm_Chr2g0113901 [Rosa chinensis]
MCSSVSRKVMHCNRIRARVCHHKRVTVIWDLSMLKGWLWLRTRKSHAARTYSGMIWLGPKIWLLEELRWCST